MAFRPLARRTIGGRGDLTVAQVVDERPEYAGIDPYNKLIDRDSDDNLVAVTIGE